ncbi:hypothetical protein DFJ74DRAFT_474685 [Hyaloraphidium curvatum]|nr:hypothetical protein DFJ74DRAFT_474685 [Hyaloraphidium curvatum]
MYEVVLPDMKTSYILDTEGYNGTDPERRRYALTQILSDVPRASNTVSRFLLCFSVAIRNQPEFDDFLSTLLALVRDKVEIHLVITYNYSEDDDPEFANYLGKLVDAYSPDSIIITKGRNVEALRQKLMEDSSKVLSDYPKADDARPIRDLTTTVEQMERDLDNLIKSRDNWNEAEKAQKLVALMGQYRSYDKWIWRLIFGSKFAKLQEECKEALIDLEGTQHDMQKREEFVKKINAAKGIIRARLNQTDSIRDAFKTSTTVEVLVDTVTELAHAAKRAYRFVFGKDEESKVNVYAPK